MAKHLKKEPEIGQDGHEIHPKEMELLIAVSQLLRALSGLGRAEVACWDGDINAVAYFNSASIVRIELRRRNNRAFYTPEVKELLG